MKLRTRLNLVLIGLTAVSVGVLIVDELHDMRSSIREEIEAANRVAAHLLGSLALTDSSADGLAAVREQLQKLGHVRANDITLRAASGEVLYRAPPPVYKAGREAPAWFARLLAPAPARQVFGIGDAELIIEAQPSRAILDAWDDLTRLVAVAVIMLLLIGGLAFWLVDRALAPFPVIVDGLERLEGGELAYRLPPLPGAEAGAIGTAFNRMAQAVEDKVQAEREARDARTRLEERRELALLIEQSVEEERRLISHELHDEFAQSVTAIRSLAMAIHTQSAAAAASEPARLICEEAGRLYDAMHGPRALAAARTARGSRRQRHARGLPRRAGGPGERTASRPGGAREHRPESQRPAHGRLGHRRRSGAACGVASPRSLRPARSRRAGRTPGRETPGSQP
ncbi:MAG: HAMP domain-containing protein [Gammaproteobacteria bacterium]|nr:MAG: HAMP domain-containing protein [Gammaproteobacteria bacterium]